MSVWILTAESSAARSAALSLQSAYPSLSTRFPSVGTYALIRNGVVWYWIPRTNAMIARVFSSSVLASLVSSAAFALIAVSGMHRGLDRSRYHRATSAHEEIVEISSQGLESIVPVPISSDLRAGTSATRHSRTDQLPT